MKHCCEDKAIEIKVLQNRQIHVLWAVLWINAFMFFIEFGAGVISQSTALLADSMDMLGDSMVYGFSLYVVNRSSVWKAKAALLKGCIMAAFGLGVLGELIYKALYPVIPHAETMGTIGVIALIANGVCFLLLWNHRDSDLNMRSTWLCSRNDIIANVGVLLAAAGVAWTQTLWPDFLVGLIIVAVFLSSAVHVLQQSIAELRALAETDT